MITALLNKIPDANLDSWYRWLTIFAISIPILGAILGGVCGWAGFVLSNRISDLQATILKQAEQDASTANNHLQYWDVAKLNAVGLTGTVGAGLQENSELNRIIGTFVHLDPNNFHWDCTSDAATAYGAAIKFNSKFPFSFYYRAGCAKANGVADWERDLETARKILLITTQIPGHHPNHDEILRFIEAGNVGKAPG